ncbi:MAG: V-type ATPase subunit [Clostridia bacterium]|nr:V-type ATPase subunit [Clostridia bacterium]
MKDTEFAFAVAKIRYAENSLISEKDLDRLIDAGSDAEARRMIAEKGYDAAVDTETMLNRASEALAAYIREISPDKNVVDFMLVANDYHNLKAALKELVSTHGMSAGFGPDGIVGKDEVKNAVLAKKFAELPEFLRGDAEKAYELLINLYDGQAADVFLDRAAADAAMRYAKQAKSEMAAALAERSCALNDIKIAYRAAYTGKDARFAEDAICPCASIDKEALIDASLHGEEALVSYLDEAGFAEAAGALRVSPADFEKYCDDALSELTYPAKWMSLGPDPLIAYYFARQTEIKNIRIIMSCRRLGLPAERIRQRVRKQYV